MFSIEASEDQQRRESSHDVDETDFGVTVRHAEQKVWEEDEQQLIREAERIAKAAEAFLDTAQDNLKRTKIVISPERHHQLASRGGGYHHAAPLQYWFLNTREYKSGTPFPTRTVLRTRWDGRRRT